jgi:selenocysteine lyase/cysteine desulfurase
MYQKHYSRFLELLGTKLHFAAHSHHAWPDVSRDAHLKYWDDSIRLIDDKWEYIFTEVIPHAQKKIAELLHLKKPKQIVFAPNTHELVFRLISTFELNRPIKILTTPNEFHSFRRQTERLAEAGQVTLTAVPADQLAQKIKNEHFDLLFFSHVFFDSGITMTTAEIQLILNATSKDTIICIDGYHAFAAIPVDLSAWEDRIFYLAGGYKYAQAGEGACFMVVPEGNWRPINTGWFAEMDHLSQNKTKVVSYAEDGAAFFGSTQDLSGLYRFNAVWDLFENEGITITKIHQYVVQLQNLFLSKINTTALSKYKLMNPDSVTRAHFLTFDLESAKNCANFAAALKQKGVLTDYRGQRLRIGFGIYQSEKDVLKLISECHMVTTVNH